MLLLPNALQKVLMPFAGLFTKPTWQKAQLLLLGALLTPRKRTVTAALRVMGLASRHDFAKYHQVLNRASWSPFEASRLLLGLLLSTFDMGGALVFGIDETLERRWGKKIKAKGILAANAYRTPSRLLHACAWTRLYTPLPPSGVQARREGRASRGSVFPLSPSW